MKNMTSISLEHFHLINLNFDLYLLRFNQFKLHSSASPRNEVGVGRVVQQGHQELPKLQWATPLIGGTLTVKPHLLFDVPCGHETADQVRFSSLSTVTLTCQNTGWFCHFIL